MVDLPPRKPRGTGKDGAPLESTIMGEMLHAINSLEYAQAFRNNVGKYKDDRGRVVTYGLALGSADIIGWVRVVAQIPAKDQDPHDPRVCFRPARFARSFAMEVKRPGKKPTEEQEKWLAAAAKHGCAATVVTSVEQAVRFVEQVRVFEDLE